MNEAHLHLLFNHLPIIIPMVGMIILITSFVLGSQIVRRIAYFIFVIGALTALPAFFTGEGAEEAVENLAGITKKIIHDHEEWAEKLAILSYILGAVSLVAIWANWKQHKFSNILSYIIIALCAVVLFFAQQTGTSGGEIRHTEIRSNSNQTGNTPTSESEHD